MQSIRISPVLYDTITTLHNPSVSSEALNGSFLTPASVTTLSLYFGEFSFNADIKYEKLKAVSSFMEIVENTDLTYTNIDLKKQKIQIELPSVSYKLYRSGRISQEPKFAPVFHSSIVLNALLMALYDFENHKEYLWAKAIEYRLENEKQFLNLSIEEKENIPEIAQRLLGNPFNRLLEGLNVIIESVNLYEE